MSTYNATKLFSAAALVLAGTLAFPNDAEAKQKKWHVKGGVGGVGAGSTLPGTTGFQFRYWPSGPFGLVFTLGADMLNGSVEPDGGDSSDFKEQDIGLGIYGEYKVLKGNKATLSAIGGFDFNSYAWEQGDEDDSYSDFRIAAGVKGEAFLAKQFSIYAQTGLVVDPLGEAELKEQGLDPDDYSISGMQFSLGGQLLGSAGFTVWFD